MAKSHRAVIEDRYGDVPSNMIEAEKYLELLGSSQDPIDFEKTETTPTDLRYRIPDAHPGHVRITYWGGSPGSRLIRGGTVLGMIADRIILQSSPSRFHPMVRKPPVLEALLDAELSYPRRLKIAANEIRRLQAEVKRLRKRD